MCRPTAVLTYLKTQVAMITAAKRLLISNQAQND